jgi:hypothetical protein
MGEPDASSAALFGSEQLTRPMNTNSCIYALRCAHLQTRGMCAAVCSYAVDVAPDNSTRDAGVVDAAAAVAYLRVSAAAVGGSHGGSRRILHIYDRT